ncbi:MAG: response regulator transcription factor [Ignavibacteriales bacterium]|nr:response regulator transcription factor [Ignavibacteriales bacterium]
MKILIADDHAVVREGLKQILSQIDEIASITEAENGINVIDLALNQKFDLILLDISMPGKSGFEILNYLKQIKPELPILIISVHPENQYAKRVLKAGAAGYISKFASPEELKQAIITSIKGEKYISRELAQELAMGLMKNKSKNPTESLSNREFEVMRLIASGKTVSEIADEICLSIKTISTYRSRILSKMNFKNNAEITKYCIMNELI